MSITGKSAVGYCLTLGLCVAILAGGGCACGRRNCDCENPHRLRLPGLLRHHDCERTGCGTCWHAQSDLKACSPCWGEAASSSKVESSPDPKTAHAPRTVEEVILPPKAEPLGLPPKAEELALPPKPEKLSLPPKPAAAVPPAKPESMISPEKPASPAAPSKLDAEPATPSKPLAPEGSRPSSGSKTRDPGGENDKSLPGLGGSGDRSDPLAAGTLLIPAAEGDTSPEPPSLRTDALLPPRPMPLRLAFEQPSATAGEIRLTAHSATLDGEQRSVSLGNPLRQCSGSDNPLR